MSERKVLSINPESFQFSKRKTRKVKPKDNENKIKVKPKAKRQVDTLRRQSLLKMIRKQQEDRYKKLLETSNSNSNNTNIINNNLSSSDNFNKDFDEAQKYLNNLTAKSEHNNDFTLKNKTLRSYPSQINNNISHEKQNFINNNTLQNIQPVYGCLKGGKLPTFRNYMNKTTSIKPPIVVGNNIPLMSNISSNINKNIPQTNNQLELNNNKIDEGTKKVSEIKQQTAILNKMKYPGEKRKNMKQRKIIIRTHKVGRSSVAPKISVLVSNKTLRNRVTTKKQLLKQKSIQEVKRYLIKHGVIRVGSTTPNDVLRKMYESMSLVCGEIQNHNPDTLLYNYLNTNDSI